MRAFQPSWCLYKDTIFSGLLVSQELEQEQEQELHPVSAQEQELVQEQQQEQEQELALPPSYSRLQKQMLLRAIKKVLKLKPFSNLSPPSNILNQKLGVSLYHQFNQKLGVSHTISIINTYAYYCQE